MESQLLAPSSRILGFDIARALAIFGMVIVNFKIAMEAQTGTHFWLGFAQLFEGRASALFVILAGVGISLKQDGSLSGLVFLRIDGNLRTSRGQRLQSDKMLILLSMPEYK